MEVITITMTSMMTIYQLTVSLIWYFLNLFKATVPAIQFAVVSMLVSYYTNMRLLVLLLLYPIDTGATRRFSYLYIYSIAQKLDRSPNQFNLVFIKRLDDPYGLVKNCYFYSFLRYDLSGIDRRRTSKCHQYSYGL